MIASGGWCGELVAASNAVWAPVGAANEVGELFVAPAAVDEVNRSLLRAELVRDEGYRKFPYDDKTGAPPRLQGKLTIGIGHNLTANGLSDAAINFIFNEHVDEVVKEIEDRWPWWHALEEGRQRAFVNLAFALGVQKLANEFQPTLKLIADGAYREAAEHVRGTLWASQVGARAHRVAQLLEHGDTK